MKRYEKAAVGLGLGLLLSAGVGAAACIHTTKKAMTRLNGPWPKEWRESADLLDAQVELLDAHYQPEHVQVTSIDGLTLRGRLYAPPGANRLAVCIHGYHCDSSLNFGELMLYYLQNGWQVLLIDQRSHGKSDGTMIGFGTLERYDVLRWLELCTERLGPDCPIILHGVSMGAATALLTTDLPLPAQVRGVVADCGYTNTRDQFDHVMRRRLGPLIKPVLCLADLWARHNVGCGLRDCDTTDALKRAAVPVLFIHGDADTFVPPEMTELNYESCTSFKMKYICPGAVHGASWHKDPSEYANVLDSFFAAVMPQ